MNGTMFFEGSSHMDERGKLKFFNTFDMKEIVRMYEITPRSVDVIRAWQGHKEEKSGSTALREGSSSTSLKLMISRTLQKH
ncbi:hypothetical protein [Maribacter halichondriae]|uniref:hypothetical protein n=1 Tax=Maribacter halichondriae TaxID=2980554 RepID=UPI00235893C2|nr:hypothetical protein [Maribacter sp. Hal144]